MDVDAPQDLAEPALADSSLGDEEVIIEDVVLVADEEPYEREITRPYQRATVPMAVQCDPPRH